ncbi:MAG: molybdopterin molybdotransferase MoeA [Lentisphaerae bacterium]|jgi:molybdopterin molybdotransferase|nr:molybdopterin molybdotransferase MoeA [Lentisphaerota bacterium]MBT4821725.1 molybdopterin molybdotransferase MoeA [Lentisphaerota bacterium]MBT5608831.1 molybdopterin molybdotransferase MoeA [Lentisphaerota bacterium]MBT7061515.1 molybdopterin molybdotransferase MoeA [Lentisphaerota bacterium]MBT7843362.1 molybdopterin molybdotransferase MoeA [Lentisphaerota bacterium]
MLTPHEAWSLVVGQTARLAPTDRPLADALGCVLAEDITGDRDDPPTDRSAMDGYAVRFADVASPPVVLAVCAELPAGVAPPETPITSGQCARIFTGGVVPPGADAVIRQEDTAHPLPEGNGRCAETETVTVLKPPKPGENIRRCGENVRAGCLALAHDCVLTPARLGVCALMGRTTVSVFRRPVTTIISTGEEIRQAGEPVQPHQTRDANGPMLATALRENGFRVDACECVGDVPDQIRGAIAAAETRSDVVVLTGGVSVGAHDYVPAVVSSLHMTTHFHHIAMKPGRSILFASSVAGKQLWGLPGNPVSALHGCHEFVLPALRIMAGRPQLSVRPALILPLAEAVRARGGRQEYRLGRLTERGECGQVAPVPSCGSGDLVAAAHADGMFVIPVDLRAIEAGTLVQFHPWRAVS